MFPFIVSMMIDSQPPVIEFIDSKDDSRMTYLIVNDCKVKIVKSRLNDMEYIITAVNTTCGAKLSKDTK